MRGEAWFATNEAKGCIDGLRSRWAEAPVAAGVPEAHARLSQAATAAFFTGEE